MAHCPKCNAELDENATKCEACGHELEIAGGTLDLSHIDQVPDASSSYGARNNGNSASEANGSQGEEVQDPEKSDVDSTLDPVTTNEAQEPNTDVASTLDAGEGGEQSGEVADFQQTQEMNRGTMPIPGQYKAGGGQPRSTKTYSDDQKREAEGFGESGTPGRLKRIWRGVATGSSQSPLQTIKGGDLEASDSVFDRISPRVLVADTIDTIAAKAADRASKPENQKNVQETIATACSEVAYDKADYELVSFLGQGGMGVVIEARQRTIDRLVAIKMIQPSSGSSDASSTQAQMKKFFYEAQITGKLDHPNIVPIYELGISNKVLFYSMKKIVGEEWKEAIQSNSKEENIEILIKVTNAMAFAHERDIIHRDLKPENVMIGEFGEVLVTDWGCAVDLARRERFAGAGSPPWMAPEMARHEQHMIGPRSDVYLLGAILYEIVAGYPPHPGSDPWECLAAAARNEILPVTTQDPLLDIAGKAMQTDPENRFHNAAEFRDALLEYQKHAESVSLTERSEVSRDQAIQTQDYELFSKSHFGFQEALELWPNNPAARTGLAETRLAYGRCAFERGDYDLCTNTLDRSVPAEAEVYSKALKAKKNAEERESRLGRTRRALIGLGAVSLIGAVGAALFMWSQNNDLVVANRLAADETVRANQEALKAKQSEAVANQKRQEAVEAQKKAVDAQKEAEDANALAQKRLLEVTAANTRAEQARDEAVDAKSDAEKARDEAVDARAAAVAAQTEAEKAQAGLALSAYQSQLGLAFAKTSSDVEGAKSTLDTLETAFAEAANFENSFKVQLIDRNGESILDEEGRPQSVKRVPALKNWAWNRIKLLTNEDTLSQKLGDGVTTAAFAAEANRGVVATVSKSGQAALHVIRLESNRSDAEASIPVDGIVESLAISDDGSEVVFTLADAGAKQSVYRLDLSTKNAPEPVRQSHTRSERFQQLLVAKNRVVAGVNGGLWVWDRAPDWSRSQPQRFTKILGRILSLQMMDENHALMLADRDGNRFVYRFNLAEPNSDGLIRMDFAGSRLQNETPSCVAFGRGRLLVGTESGRLFAAPFDTNSDSVGPDFIEATDDGQEPAHNSAINNIKVHPDGSLLTTAREAVTVVWKPSEKASGWSYDSLLVGTPSSVSSASFMVSSNLVFAVGEKGRPIVWDVQRQRQRYRVSRIAEDGTELVYQSPVVEIVPTEGSDRITAVHRDGTLDSYDAQTGKTIALVGAPETDVATYAKSIHGHTPGTSFVDMAIDADSDVMVTSALVPADYIDTGDDSLQRERLKTNWEYCRWQLSTGKLLARWRRTSATEQEISLADAGKLILYASDEKTVLGRTDEQHTEDVFNQEPGSFFGVQHPRSESTLMLVKRSGAVRVFDTANSQIVAELPESQKEVLLAANEVPLVGDWSPMGDRFYMVWSSGRITEFRWQGQQLDVVRDLRQPQLRELGIAWTLTPNNTAQSPVKEVTQTITSRHRIDLKVRAVGSTNVLLVAARFPGVNGLTRLSKVQFPNGNGQVVASQKSLPLKKLRLVLTDGPELGFATESLKQLPLDISKVVAAETIGDDTFVATGNATIYRIDPSGAMQVFGQPQVISASGSDSGDRIVTLSAESGTRGVVLRRADFLEGSWHWTALKPVDSAAQRIEISPDGSRLLITLADNSGLQILNAETGEVQTRLPSGVCGSWDPDAAADLAVVTTDREVQLFAAGQEQPQKIETLPTTGQVQGINYFRENWSEGVPATRWIVVNCITSDGVELHYVGLNPDYKLECEPLMLESGVKIIECSPTENILAVGGQGSLQIYFANPTLKEPGKELFSLDGHSNDELSVVRFSSDGKTIMSADVENRLFGWLSSDAKNGISEKIDLQLKQGVAQLDRYRLDERPVSTLAP